MIQQRRLTISNPSIGGSGYLTLASMQADAAIAGKVDYLKGLKENVIMGRIIPAGTGLTEYRELTVDAGE